MNEVYVELYEGKGKKTGKEFQAIKVTIGDWSGLLFPRSAFEWNYIKKVLGKNDN